MTLRWPRFLIPIATGGLLIALISGALAIAYGRIADTSLQLSVTIMKGIGDLVAQRTLDIQQDAYHVLTTNVAFAQALGIGQRDLIADAASWQGLFWHQLTSGDEWINAVYLADPRGNLVELYREPQWTLRTVIRQQGGKAVERLEYRSPDASTPLARIERDTTHDPRERPWYQAALSSDTGIWSPIYVFSEGPLGTTLAQAIRDNQGQVKAVVGVDVILGRVSQLLSQHAFSEHDIALIVNQRQEVIVYSSRLAFAQTVDLENRLPQITEIAPEQSWVVRANDLLPDDVDAQTPVVRFNHQGVTYFAFGRPISLLGIKDRWRLLIVASEEDVLGDTHRALDANLALVALSLLLAAFVLFVLSCNLRRSPSP